MSIEDFKKFKNAFLKIYREQTNDICISQEIDTHHEWMITAGEKIEKSLEYMWKIIEEIKFYWLD